MIILETKEDIATVVHNWQQDMLMQLEEWQAETDPLSYQAYQDAISILENLPFTSHFIINEEVMCQEPY